jgi:hypothetical protein
MCKKDVAMDISSTNRHTHTHQSKIKQSFKTTTGYLNAKISCL